MLQVTGGLSNHNYRVTVDGNIDAPEVAAAVKAGAPTEVLLRRFGTHTSSILDRESEKLFMAAAGDAGLAPRVLAAFDGGGVNSADCECAGWALAANMAMPL